jgi:hypothetical protein
MSCRIFALLVVSAMIVIFLLVADNFPSSVLPKRGQPSWVAKRP